MIEIQHDQQMLPKSKGYAKLLAHNSYIDQIKLQHPGIAAKVMDWIVFEEN